MAEDYSWVKIECPGTHICTGTFHILADPHRANESAKEMFEMWFKTHYFRKELTYKDWSYNGTQLIYNGSFHCKNGRFRQPVERHKSRHGTEFMHVVAKTEEEATRIVRQMYPLEHLPETLDWKPFRHEFVDLQWGETYDLSKPIPVVVDEGFFLEF